MPTMNEPNWYYMKNINHLPSFLSSGACLFLFLSSSSGAANKFLSIHHSANAQSAFSSFQITTGNFVNILALQLRSSYEAANQNVIF